MAVHSGLIDTYSVNVLSPVPYDGKRLIGLSGSFGRAFLWFYPESTSLPANRKRAGRDMFDVHYHESAWGAIVDVLRNESPVRFSFSESNGATQIYTGQEPVGEEEASAA